MKFWCQLWIGTVITCLVASTAWAEPTTNAKADKTMAPYFFVEGGDPTLDRMPLKSTEVKVNIAGVIAQVTRLPGYHYPEIFQPGKPGH